MEFSYRIINLLLGLILVSFLVGAVSTFKFGSQIRSEKVDIEISDIVKVPSFVTLKNLDRSLECLTMNVYREAGAEPFEGKVAVAQVTLNRANHPAFPKDICGVVYQRNLIMEKIVCQFSWYCEGSLRNKPSNSDAYQESYAVAKKVLLEGFKLEKLSEALYFHSVDVKPSWPYEKLGKVGNHIFYKERT